jgi:acetyl esterase/lipase
MKHLPFVVAATILLLAIPTILIAQVTILDTVYTPAGYPDSPLWARIYIPAPANAKGVGIVMTHGYTGPPKGEQFWVDSLVAHGYLVMAVEHPDMTVAPNGLYPRLVRATKTAVQFLRMNAVQFGITTGKIVGWGNSQGAMIWGQTIIWDNDHAYFGTNPAINDHVDAAILLYGLYHMSNYMPNDVYDLLTIHFSLNPSLRSSKGQCLTNVSNITTPILLLHATGDPTVYIQHSRMLRDSLIFRGRYVRLIEFNSSSHTFDKDKESETQFSTLGLVAKDSALAFLNSVLIQTSVRGFSGEVPSGFALAQNYPNPFNPSTTIDYQLTADSHVTLKVFDLFGQEVMTLVDEVQDSGVKSVKVDASNLASGVYLYQLRAGSFVTTKKFLILR